MEQNLDSELNKKTLVLSLSGGLDSTCLLMSAINKGYDPIFAYSFNYGQRHNIELKKLKKNINFLQKRKNININWKILDVRSIFEDNTSALYKDNILGDTIPEGHYEDIVMKRTVVPLRNVIFDSIIAAKALNLVVKNNLSEIYIASGVHSGDHAIYPDCRPESQNLTGELFRVSDWNGDKLRFLSPFINMNKGQVLLTGIYAMQNLGFMRSEIKKVLKNTNSCYSPAPDGTPCGKCGTCIERAEAFEIARNSDSNLKWIYDPVIMK